MSEDFVSYSLWVPMPWACDIRLIPSLPRDDQSMEEHARRALIEYTRHIQCPQCGRKTWNGSLRCSASAAGELPSFYCQAPGSPCAPFETRFHWSKVKTPNSTALHIVIGAWLQWEPYALSITRPICPAPKISHKPAPDYRRITNFQSKLPICEEGNGYLYTRLKHSQSGLCSKIIPVVQWTLVNGRKAITPIPDNRYKSSGTPVVDIHDLRGWSCYCPTDADIQDFHVLLVYYGA